MFGKIFASLYSGSMVGAGPVPYALMPYVITNARPDAKLGGFIELNPKLLSVIIGTSEEEIEKGIEFLCRPDPKSRTPDEEGRRLVKIGPFDYRVVNFAKYRAIRDEEERREQNRLAQERFREKQRQKAQARKSKDKSKVNPADTDAMPEKGLQDVNGTQPQSGDDINF